MTITQPYVYFVSYNLTTADGRTGAGSADVVYDRPVTRFTDVEVLTQKVCEKLATRGVDVPLSNVVVLNYKLLSGPTGNDGDMAEPTKPSRSSARRARDFGRAVLTELADPYGKKRAREEAKARTIEAFREVSAAVNATTAAMGSPDFVEMWPGLSDRLDAAQAELKAAVDAMWNAV